jgi:L-arabinose isomerase
MRRTKVGLVADGLGAYWPQFPDLLPQLEWSAERVSERPVTTFGIAQRRDGAYRFVASAGTVVTGPVLKIGNTTSRVDFGCDPGEWTDAWSATGISHHWALGTGNLLPELRATAELLGIELAEVAAPARDEVLQ